MVVTRGAAPVDAARCLARYEATILPEVLARSCAATAMQPVDHRCRNPARLQDEAGHGSRERTGFPGRALRCLVFLVARSWVSGHRSSDARLEPADHGLDGFA